MNEREIAYGKRNDAKMTADVLFIPTWGFYFVIQFNATISDRS